MENEKVVNEEVKPETESEVKDSKPVEGEKKFHKFDRKGGKKPFNKGGKKFEEKKEYQERVVFINRVTKVVKGGKRMKFSALVVVGNGKGKYGFASCKAGEVPDAIKKAVEKAKKNIKFVRIIKADTIAHEVIGSYGATRVYLKPAKEGTGVIAGGAVRSMLELSGIRNVCSKVYGSRTKINVVRATNDALQKLKNSRNVKALRSINMEGGVSDVK